MRIEDYDPAIIETVRRSIASWKDNIAQQECREETLHQQYQSGKSSIDELQKRKQQLETQYFSLQKQIDQFDQSDLKKLQQKKITLTQRLGEYSDRLDLERFAVYGVDITSLT
jgi:chromosome segregation ATPase